MARTVRNVVVNDGAVVEELEQPFALVLVAERLRFEHLVHLDLDVAFVRRQAPIAVGRRGCIQDRAGGVALLRLVEQAAEHVDVHTCSAVLTLFGKSGNRSQRWPHSHSTSPSWTRRWPSSASPWPMAPRRVGPRKRPSGSRPSSPSHALTKRSGLLLASVFVFLSVCLTVYLSSHHCFSLSLSLSLSPSLTHAHLPPHTHALALTT